jgi:hypothetical protein
MKAYSQVIGNGSQNVAHIVGILERLARKMPDKIEFVAHIKERGLLGGGVGLVMYWLGHLRKQKPPENHCIVYLSSRFAEQLCPRQRGGKTITKLLVESGILVPHLPAVVGVMPTGYQVAEEWVGVRPDKLTEWQRRRLIKARAWKYSTDCKKSPALAWVEESITRITLPHTEVLNESMQDPRTHQAALEGYKYLWRLEPPEERKTSWIGYAGTIYTPIMSLPRQLVPTLLIDGEPVSQLDITSAHPSTIPRLLTEAELKYSVVGGVAEAQRLTNELQSGRLYDALGFECGLTAKAAKKRFLSALNGEDGHTYNDSVFKKFVERYPAAKKVFGKIRKGDKNRLNRKMAGLLAEAMRLALEACAKTQSPVYPRTDELVCRVRDSELIRKVLAASIYKVTSVNPAVGGVNLPLEEIEAATKLLNGEAMDYR